MLCGHYFDAKIGYCVVIAFRGSSQANYMTPEFAHEIAERLRAGEDDNSLIAFAANIDQFADEMAFQNEVWRLAGYPADGIDSQIVGRA